MKEFSTSIDIHASPAAIWKILTDSARYPEWDPGIIRIEGTIAPGQRLTIYTKAAPERAFAPIVTEFEANRRMLWRSAMPLGLFIGERSFLLEPSSSGSQRFTMCERYSGLLLPMIGRTIPDLNPTFNAFSTALKQRAEATLQR